MSGREADGAVIWGIMELRLYRVRCPLPLCADFCATMARLRIERTGDGWRVLRAALTDDGNLYAIGDDPLSRSMPTREDAEAFAHGIELRSIWAGPWL